MGDLIDGIVKAYRLSPPGIVQGIVEKQYDVLAGKDAAANVQADALKSTGEYIADIPKKLGAAASKGVNKMLWLVFGLLAFALVVGGIYLFSQKIR